MSQYILNKSIFIKADKEKVWAFLTDAEKLAMWFHKPDNHFEEGAHFRMIGADSGEAFMFGDIVKASPYDTLVYEFTIPMMGTHVSRATWHLTSVVGGTHVALLHEGLPQETANFDSAKALDAGWDKHLGLLRDAADKS